MNRNTTKSQRKIDRDEVERLEGLKTKKDKKEDTKTPVKDKVSKTSSKKSNKK